MSDKKPICILFVVDQLYEHGGIERVLCVKANALSRMQAYKVIIGTTNQAGRPIKYQLDQAVTVADMSIDYDRSRSYFHPKNIMKLGGHVKSYRRLLAKHQPDVVVICNHGMETFFAPLVSRKPVLKEFHFSQSMRQKAVSRSKKLNNKLLYKVYPKYKSLVVLNPDEATFFDQFETSVIPNPITFSRSKASNLEGLRAIAAGRIAAVKGFEDMIDSWKLVVDVMPEATLTIYGDGEPAYLNGLLDRVKQLGLSNNIEFAGATDDMPSAMQKASVYLMTSLNECFPLVLLEALATGLPIVSFDIPTGPKHIVTPQCGILIADRDKQALASAVCGLLADNDRRRSMGMAALERSKDFNIDRVIGLWLKLFDDITKDAQNT